jgi:hypothetical protein
MIRMLLLTPALVAAGLVAVALIEILIRRPDVAAAMVFVAVIVQAVFVDQVPSIHLGGPRIYVTDVVSASVAVAGVARVLRLRRIDRYHRWLVLLGVTLVVSLIRGAAAYGVQASVNDFRQYLFFFGVALYFSTFAPSPWRSDRIGRIWLVMTIPMMVLVALRWVQVFAGMDLGVPRATWGADAAIRVIDGPYVFFLTCAFILTVPAWVRGGGSRRFRWLSALLALFVLMLDRRTAWLTIVVGLAVLLLHDRRLGRRALVLVTVSAVVSVAAFVWLGGLGEGGNEQLLASGSGNLTWRVEGWSQLVGSWSQNPADWFVGEPFGSGFARVVEGDTIVTHPHNFYIETMIRAGIVGVTALIALTVGLMKSLWRTPDRDFGLLGPGVLPSLLAMQVVWFLTWVPGSEQGIVTGLALAAAAWRARVPHGLPAPHLMPLTTGDHVLADEQRPIEEARS